MALAIILIAFILIAAFSNPLTAFLIVGGLLFLDHITARNS